ncbi:MAG: ATP-dependent endonuclease, partial [Actinobacteria bacterium]|nr:ATP-dependent endonuclease [Actinomycetota bacterium]
AVLGLYDAAELRYVLGALVAADLLADGEADPAAVERAGFFGCEQDLEDEVIRAAGSDAVIDTLAARGELALFRVFQGQPAQRVRSVEAQLHRFAGTASGRKAHFAADVIATLPADRIPDPLARLLDAVAATG